MSFVGFALFKINDLFLNGCLDLFFVFGFLGSLCAYTINFIKVK